MHVLFFILIFAFGMTFYTSSGQAAVFGFDDRTLVTPHSAHYLRGRSTAVGILWSFIEKDESSPPSYKIYTEPLHKLFCTNEKFSSQPSLNFACSGFLVGPDLLATAGHCMVNFGISQNEPGLFCESYGWLFGYESGTGGNVHLDNIPEKNYYKCKKIVYAIKEDDPPYRDYALVQLDRTVEGREPLVLSTENVKVHDSIYMLGYPMGIPLTLSNNARVLVYEEQDTSFYTDLDAFDGNSGSAVFNRKNQVVGILVGGTPLESFISLKEDSKNSCYVYNKCDKQGRNCTQDDQISSFIFQKTNRSASEVQKIEPILDLIREYNLKRE